MDFHLHGHAQLHAGQYLDSFSDYTTHSDNDWDGNGHTHTGIHSNLHPDSSSFKYTAPDRHFHAHTNQDIYRHKHPDSHFDFDCLWRFSDHPDSRYL